ncbi:MAG: superoxide dismutase family protein, partial [Pseudomonadota bacterium]
SATEVLPLILDEDGAAVMLHAGPDDYISDPAGAAGPRIACGVLTASSD